jgi:nucleotide-binding universal stress UspA family protein
MAQRIVVGVDGSEGALAALRWTAEEAAQWDADVVAVQAWEFTPLIVATEAPIDLAELRRETDELLDAQVRKCFGDREGRVERRVVEDLPARAVLDAAADADLIVVGSRGRGGLKGLLLGSVSQKVVSHAPCPVVVVPGPHAGDRG